MDPVTISEMYGFLAIILNTGISAIPDIWSTSWVSHVPFFGQLFSKNRFEIILWMLHVSSTPTGHTPKRLHKVHILLNTLVSNFKRCMRSISNLSVDETMMGFSGRFGAKQYMTNMPTKYGIKAFTIADSANGYILDALLYTGVDTLENSNP